MTVTRRLAAILAADVAGYSRLMGGDEGGTLQRLRAHRRELVDPKIREHQGRIVKTTGDGMLVEFASVVDAVRCAVEIQRAMVDRNVETPEDKRITFRIGVNLGDVIAAGDDIYGDGVNIAARLEALAEPGGVCISRTVRDHIGDRLPYPFDDIGEQSVKNIAQPVHAFTISAATVASLPEVATPAQPDVLRRHTPPLTVVAASLVGVVGIGAAVWWTWPNANSPAVLAQAPAVTSAQNSPASEAKAAPRLSIVVLPFGNLSNDPEQQYFADGITENLTTDLSRISNMLVISRNTAFTYREKPVRAKQIGKDLGVRYVIEGSVQRSGNQVRVTAQLIDAETDVHLWAERVDHDMTDLFTLQNVITSRIANTLKFELISAEAGRPTDNPDAVDYILRGRDFRNKGASQEHREKAIGFFEKALALDPRSVEAQSRLAGALVNRGITVTDTTDFRRAETLISQALAASPRDAYAHFVKGRLSMAERRCEEAIPEFVTALALDRNLLLALHSLSVCKFLTGSGDAAIPLIEQAIHLSPRDRDLTYWYAWLGFMHLMQSRTDEAIVWLEKALSADPQNWSGRYFLASAYGIKDDLHRAAAQLAEARRLNPTDRYSTIARVRTNGDLNTPAVRAQFETIFVAGLRKAGMPEE
jgi:TolB-like protein/class 3 adenylate cyclase/Flp pilus assembly protein TadD